MSVELEDAATFLWWETIWPGREAAGEVFRYDALSLRTEIAVCGSVIARENAELRPLRKAMDSAIRMGPYRYLTSFYLCQPGRSQASWRNLEERLAMMAKEFSSLGREALWGVSVLPEHGMVVRGLATSSTEVSSGLNGFWREARPYLTGQAAIRPRKLY